MYPNDLSFIVAVDPSEVPHALRGGYDSWGRCVRLFRNFRNAKTSKRLYQTPNLRLFEVVYDPADDTANALRVTSEIE